MKRVLVLIAAGLAGASLAVVPALASHETVTVSGTSWSPERVAVDVDENHDVAFTNNSGFTHNLTWTGSPQPDDNPNQANGNLWSKTVTFDTEAVGEYRFECTL